MINLDIWWSSLTVAQKERIATKGNKSETLYPACTAWWNSLPKERKEIIHDEWYLLLD
ncbi:MAG: hypothetical protein MJZ16_02905 [Bacteroidales bacterium]|nr:hypothetical protein [Bacteroidales bacterium]